MTGSALCQILVISTFLYGFSSCPMDNLKLWMFCYCPILGYLLLWVLLLHQNDAIPLLYGGRVEFKDGACIQSPSHTASHQINYLIRAEAAPT